MPASAAGNLVLDGGKGMPSPPVGYPRLSGATIDAIIDATVQIATQRLSGAISVDEVSQLRAQAASTLEAAERLHAYPLLNADEPAFGLSLPGGSCD
jgi:hypothetical protein